MYEKGNDCLSGAGCGISRPFVDVYPSGGAGSAHTMIRIDHNESPAEHSSVFLTYASAVHAAATMFGLVWVPHI